LLSRISAQTPPRQLNECNRDFSPATLLSVVRGEKPNLHSGGVGGLTPQIVLDLPKAKSIVFLSAERSTPMLDAID
jgi:hypothetical protein